MPLRGETIGTAFIRILADGNEFPRSVDKEIRKAEKNFEREGEVGSQAWNRGFNRQQKRDKNVEKSLVRTIHDAFGQVDSTSKTLSGNFGKNLTRHITDGIRSSFPELEKISTQLGERMSKDILKDFAETGTFNLNLRKRLKTAMNDIAPQSLMDRIHHLGTELDLVGNKVSKAFGAKARNNALNIFGRGVGSIVEVTARLFIGLTNVVEKTRTFADAISKTFTEAGGGLQGFAAVAKDGATSLLKLSGGFAGAIVLLSIFATGMGVIASVLSGVAAAITALAASITFGLIGALAPLVGLLAPVAIGVAALTLAISGQVKANSANQKVLNAANQAVAKWRNEVKATTPGTKDHTKAVQNLAQALRDQKAAQDTANQTLGGALSAVKADFKDLQKTAAQGLFSNAPAQVRALRPVLATLKPLIGAAATGISQVFNGFLAGMNSKGFKDFIASMTTFVPNVLRSLGRIAGPIFAGIGGLFVALEPTTLTFLDAVEKIARSFGDWANSATGRKEIKDFLKKAADSAQALWNLLKDVGAVLATLFSQGKTSGDNIITSLSGSLKDFNQFLKDNPDAVKSWFKNGEQVAKDIGNIIVAVGQLIGVLDSPANRKLAGDIFSILIVSLKLLGPILGALLLPTLALIAAYKGLDHAGNVMIDGVKRAWVWFDNLGKIMRTGLISAFSAVIRWMNNFGNTMIDKVRGAISSVFSWISGLPGRIRGLGGQFTNAGSAIIHALTNGLSHAGGFLGNLASGLWNVLRAQINRAIDTINNHLVLHIPFAPDINPPDIPHVARGGLFMSPRHVVLAEAGAEAVVPLHRDLSQVDPAVRALSAFAQGLSLPGGGGSDSSRRVDASGWTIMSNAEDPRAVARETLNTLVAAAI